MKLKNILLTALVVLAGSVLSFYLFSHTNSFSIQSWQNPKTDLAKYREQQGRYLVLNAQEIFGNNLTDTLSQVLAQHLASYYPEGLSQFPEFNSAAPITGLNAEEIRQGAATLFSQVSQEMQYYRSSKELKVVSNTSANKKQYLADLGQLVHAYLAEFANQGDLLSWYNQVTEKNDSQARKNLARYAEQSQKLLNDLENLSVPQTFSQLHLDYLNILYESRYTALGLLLEQDDPVRTEVVIENYPGLNVRYVTYLAALAKKIR